MPALPRGKCSVCRREVALRRNGAVREHKRWIALPYEVMCDGSGVLPYSDSTDPVDHVGHSIQGVWDVPHGAPAEVKGDRIVVSYASSKSFDAESETVIECGDCIVALDLEGYDVEDDYL